MTRLGTPLRLQITVIKVDVSSQHSPAKCVAQQSSSKVSKARSTETSVSPKHPEACLHIVAISFTCSLFSFSLLRSMQNTSTLDLIGFMPLRRCQSAASRFEVTFAWLSPSLDSMITTWISFDCILLKRLFGLP